MASPTHGPQPRHDVAPAPSVWSAERFFTLLRQLGPLRVISVCGPSVFETLCRVDEFEVRLGFLNAITPAYHWHLRLAGFRELCTRDEIHARSGRRVLFFELREDAGAQPFLRIYLHRERECEFDADREARFLEAHRELAGGVRLTNEVRA